MKTKMARWFLMLGAVAMALMFWGVAAHADTYTTGDLVLTKPSKSSLNWDGKINGNFDIVAASAATKSSTQTFTGQNTFNGKTGFFSSPNGAYGVTIGTTTVFTGKMTTTVASDILDWTASGYTSTFFGSHNGAMSGDDGFGFYDKSNTWNGRLDLGLIYGPQLHGKGAIGAPLLGLNTSTPKYAFDVTGGGHFTSSMTVDGGIYGSTLTLTGEIYATSATFSGPVYGVSLSEIEDLTANKVFTMANKTLEWQFTNPTDGMKWDFTGAAGGHSLEVMQETGNPGTDMHLLHIHAEDPDPVTLHLVPGGTTSRALMVHANGDTLTNAGRFEMTGAGAMAWGDGGAGGADTNLYRSAANVLKTDDSLVAVGSMTANKYYGDGSTLSNIITSTAALQADINSRVSKAGDTMTGQLTTASTITVQGNAFSVGGDTLSVNSGMVGIGAAGTSNKLTVVTESAASGLLLRRNSTTPATQVRLNFSNSTSDTIGAYIASERTADATSSRLILATTEKVEVSGNQFSVGASSFAVVQGNVGVGTASPAFASGSGLEIERASTATLRIQSVSAPAAVELSADWLGTNLHLRGIQQFRVTNESSELLRLTTSGNLGIGTATPIFRSGYAAPWLTIKSDAPGLILDDTGSTTRSRYFNNNAGLLEIGQMTNDGTSAVTHLAIAHTSGNIGMGNNTPARNLSVSGGASPAFVQVTNTAAGLASGDGGYMAHDGTDMSMGNQEVGDLKLFVRNNSTQGIIIKTQGAGDFNANVGIGTITPSSRLHVVGNVTLSSNTALTTYTETKSSAAVATTYDVSWSSGSVYWLSLNDNTTLTFSGAVDGQSLTLFVKQNVGSKAITWPTILWPSATAPTLTTTAGKTDIITLVYIGGVYYGFLGGLNY